MFHTYLGGLYICTRHLDGTILQIIQVVHSNNIIKNRIHVTELHNPYFQHKNVNKASVADL